MSNPGAEHVAEEGLAAKEERARIVLEKCEKAIDAEAKAPSRIPANVKKLTQQVLSGIHQTVEVLEGVAEFSTQAKAAVGIFKAVIKLEDTRRENNEQIVLVCHMMTRAMFTLTALPKQASEDPRLTDELKDCCTTMENFGDFADVYYSKYKKYPIVSFLRATTFKEKLKSYADQFNAHRDQLSFILTASHTSTLEIISTNVDRILMRLDIPSAATAAAARIVTELGGAQAVCDNPQLPALQRIGTALSGGSAPPPVTSLTVEALRTNVDDLLENNRSLFALKLAAAQREIEESVNRSADKILQKLNSGAHELIMDADVREVWKANDWKLGVKCRQFADSLYTHFAMKPRLQDTNSGVDDSWTLQVISKVINHPAIGEAIDEDASGFLSVHEVNHFFQKKPAGHTSPMWLAFWGVGWHHMNEYYTAEIASMIRTMTLNCKTLQIRLHSEIAEADDTEKQAKIMMSRIVVDLFQQAIKKLGYVMDWVDADDDLILEDYETTVAHKIDEDAKKISGGITSRMEANLKACDFVIDDTTFNAIIGESDARIELFFMPLIFVLLTHVRARFENPIQTQAEEFEDFMAEVYTMSLNILGLLYIFNDRMKSLLRSWRSQKVNAELQIKCYAGGLMYGWWKEYTTSEEMRKFLAEDDSDDEGTGLDGEEPQAAAEVSDATASDSQNLLSTRVDALDNRLARIESTLGQILAALPSLVQNADLHQDRPLARHNDRSDRDHGNVPASHVDDTRAEDGEGMRADGSDSQAFSTAPGLIASEMGTAYDSQEFGRGEAYAAESRNESSWEGRGNVGDEPEGGYEDQRETGDGGEGGDGNENENEDEDKNKNEDEDEAEGKDEGEGKDEDEGKDEHEPETATETWNSNEYDD